MKNEFLINCDCCLKVFDYPGALIFSPPGRDGKYHKYHICGSCFIDIGTTERKLFNIEMLRKIKNKE